MPYRRPLPPKAKQVERPNATLEMMGREFEDKPFGVSGGEMLPTPEPAPQFEAVETFTIDPPPWADQLEAGVLELARVMGTSVAMIERHYGALLDGAHAGIVGRLDALEAGLEQATEAEAR